MRKPANYAAAGLAIIAMFFAWRAGDRAQGLDFYQFWIGGQTAHRATTTHFYSAESRKALGAEFLLRAQTTERSDRMLAVATARPQLELYSTPLLYATFGLFSGHYDRDLFLYRILCLASTVAAILLLGATLGDSPARTLLMLAFVLLLFEPLRSDIRVGNVNQLQLLLVALFLWLDARRAVAAGFVLAIAILFKPNVAMLLPLLVAQRLFTGELSRLKRQLAGAVAGALTGLAIGSLFFRSPAAWLDWLAAARTLSQTLLPATFGNVAIALPLARAFGPIAAYLLLLVLTAATLFLMRRARSADIPLVTGLALLLYLLSATLVWLHYLLLVIPLAMALLRPGQRIRQVAIVVIALLLIGNGGGQAYLLAIWIGLVGLFAVSLHDVSRGSG